MKTLSTATLPLGWQWSQDPERSELQAEYEIELPKTHPLQGVEVDVVAHREGNDDILVRHRLQHGMVSVVHLSWARRQELPNHPTVEFTGSHAEFLLWELNTFGIGTAEP